jgi:diguanylate cyclase (GGDEF)-like protein/PAS domain S-box-containing protein
MHDAKGRITVWNHACETLYGLPAASVLGKTLAETVARTGSEENLRQAVNSVMDGQAVEGLEVVSQCAGVECYLLCSLLPVRSVNGTIVGGISVNVDITQHKKFGEQIEEQRRALQETNARLKLVVTIDEITGLKNKRAFQERLREEFHRARRYNLPLSLALVSIDGFDDLNRSFGRPAGEHALKVLGNILRRSTRKSDFIASCGDGEFALLLPNTGREGAITMARQVRGAIETAPWRERAVTASFAMSTLTSAMRDSAVLRAAADKALLHAREQGGNYIMHAGDLEEPLNGGSTAR